MQRGAGCATALPPRGTLRYRPGGTLQGRSGGPQVPAGTPGRRTGEPAHARRGVGRRPPGTVRPEGCGHATVATHPRGGGAVRSSRGRRLRYGRAYRWRAAQRAAGTAVPGQLARLAAPSLVPAGHPRRRRRRVPDRTSRSSPVRLQQQPYPTRSRRAACGGTARYVAAPLRARPVPAAPAATPRTCTVAAAWCGQPGGRAGHQAPRPLLATDPAAGGAAGRTRRLAARGLGLPQPCPRSSQPYPPPTRLWPSWPSPPWPCRSPRPGRQGRRPGLPRPGHRALAWGYGQEGLQPGGRHVHTRQPRPRPCHARARPGSLVCLLHERPAPAPARPRQGRAGGQASTYRRQYVGPQ